MTIEEKQFRLGQLEARYADYQELFRGRKQCGGKVIECESAVCTVKVPNGYDVQRYGAWSLCKFCPRCLRKSTQIQNPSKDSIAAAAPWNKAAVDALIHERAEEQRACSRVYEELTQLKRQVENELSRQNYEEYIQTPQWKAKRGLVITRCKNVCEGCHAMPVHQVHHLTYDNFGDELLFQLVGLCVGCHDKCHPWKKEKS